MDVIEADGAKLARPTFRRCMVCGRQAQECARARAHPVSELQAAVERLLSQAGIAPLI
ncbi:MAG: citrate lyase holo-[Fretibacterium sp.]|nr:citrate lyase holo-[acyl-carrier protein] synthase [Fretibacterium sp.]